MGSHCLVIAGARTLVQKIAQNLGFDVSNVDSAANRMKANMFGLNPFLGRPCAHIMRALCLLPLLLLQQNLPPVVTHIELTSLGI